jgi:hypothetical protein
MSLSFIRASIRTGAIAIGGLIFFLVSTSEATAMPNHFAIPASRSMELQAKGSHGFGITVSGISNQVYLTVRGHHANNTYMVRGRFRENEIKALFGRLGRISMRFRAGHKARVVPVSDGNCKGAGEVIERGSFIGTLNFRGEQGYTTVRTARAAGRVVRSGRLVCEAGPEQGGAPGPHWLLFSASSKNGRVSFGASKVTSKAHPELDFAFFNATIVELHPRGMSVIRTLDTQAMPTPSRLASRAGTLRQQALRCRIRS